jgi:hypothetical protein
VLVATVYGTYALTDKPEPLDKRGLKRGG